MRPGLRGGKIDIWRPSVRARWLMPWDGTRAPRQERDQRGQGPEPKSVLATGRQSGKRMQALLARKQKEKTEG